MQSLTTTSAKYTYLGTLDDMVAKYPWGYTIDLNFLNRTLARSALFGTKIILPDGYLMNLLAARSALMQPQYSPLLDLIHGGHVVVVSRAKDLSTIPALMKEKGVASFPDLLENADWNKLKRNLEKLTRWLADKDNFWDWPIQDMGTGFKRTILRARNKDVRDLGILVPQDILDRTFDLFEESMAGDSFAARTRWENVVKFVSEKYLGTKQQIEKAKHELMYLGNEAYHYNFTGCLCATTGQSIAVETRFSPTFANMIDLFDDADTGAAKYYPKTLPPGFPLYNGRLLAEVVRPDTDLNEAKNQYLLSLKQHAEKQLDIGQVESDASHYSRLLSRHFYGDTISNRWKLGLSFGANMLISLADLDLGRFSVAVQAGITALIWQMDRLLPPYIIALFAVKDKTRDRRFFESNRKGFRIPVEHPHSKMVSVKMTESSINRFFKRIRKFGGA